MFRSRREVLNYNNNNKSAIESRFSRVKKIKIIILKKIIIISSNYDIIEIFV